MAEVKVFYDRTGNTLVVWFGNPQDEVEAEETGDEVILMKDQQGQVIGFEKLNFLPPSDHPIRIKWLELVHQIARWGDRFVCDSLL